MDNTTTRLINEVLVNTKYSGVQDTTGFGGFKNELVKVNLAAVESIPVLPDNKKMLEKVEDTCVKAGYNEISKEKIALRYNYTQANLVFMIFGVLAFFVAFLLKAEDRKKGYGLEKPNVEE